MKNSTFIKIVILLIVGTVFSLILSWANYRDTKLIENRCAVVETDINNNLVCIKWVKIEK